MLRISSYQKRLQRLWQVAIDPPESVVEPVHRYQIRLLNSILIVFIPLALITLTIYFLFLPTEDSGLTTSALAILMGVGVCLIIYLVNHTRHYRMARYVTIVAGFTAVIANAIASSPPHLEIAYLIMLPLIGTLIFSFRETLVVCLLNIVCLMVFAVIMGDVPADITKDLLTFIIFVQVFILFLNRQRNQLELDRQELAVEQGRNTLLKQLITNLSHDFRTPLTVIITSAYLADRIKDPVQQKEKLEQINRQALRLNHLIEEILLMSALDQMVDQSLEYMNLNSLIRTLHHQFGEQAKEKSIQFQLDLQEQMDLILMNMDNLRLALTNLIDNALSYTEPGGLITIRTFADSTHVVVEIVDTGIGISPIDLAMVFTPFFRADISRSSDTGGMGLGLAITKRVVELHGGTVTVESALGQGSTFRLRLPLTPVKGLQTRPHLQNSAGKL